MEPNMPQENEDRVLESLKLDHESFKHLTTVSTGSILILAAFLEKLLKAPELKWLIPLTFFALIVAAYTSVVQMFQISHAGVLAVHGTGDRRRRKFPLVALLSCGCFFLGMLSLSIFVTWNFYRSA